MNELVERWRRQAEKARVDGSLQFDGDIDVINAWMTCAEELERTLVMPTIDHSKDLGIGRIVHYVAYGTPGGEFPSGTHRAAIITRLDSYGIGEFMDHPTVSVCILNPTGIYFATEVPYDESGEKTGTWHWPERDRPQDTP